MAYSNLYQLYFIDFFYLTIIAERLLLGFDMSKIDC